MALYQRDDTTFVSFSFQMRRVGSFLLQLQLHHAHYHQSHIIIKKE